jgi:hypothetical protein
VNNTKGAKTKLNDGEMAGVIEPVGIRCRAFRDLDLILAPLLESTEGASNLGESRDNFSVGGRLYSPAARRFRIQ